MLGRGSHRPYWCTQCVSQHLVGPVPAQKEAAVSNVPFVLESGRDIQSWLSCQWLGQQQVMGGTEGAHFVLPWVQNLQQLKHLFKVVFVVGGAGA